MSNNNCNQLCTDFNYIIHTCIIIDNNTSTGDEFFLECHATAAVEFEAALDKKARGFLSGSDIPYERGITHRRRHDHFVQSGMQMHTYMLDFTVYII